jgi:hypothetical protein
MGTIRFGVSYGPRRSVGTLVGVGTSPRQRLVDDGFSEDRSLLLVEMVADVGKGVVSQLLRRAVTR